jgi:hypothetical protein
MNGKPTRRSFFGHAGAALAAPLAAAAATAPGGSDDLAARLAQLEDLDAIRALLPGLLANPARLDACVRRLAPDGADATAVAIAVPGDGTATAHVRCTAETATPIEGSGTLVEMARLQGDGFVVRSERRMLVGAFVKSAEGWTVTRAKLEVTV